MTKLRAIVLLIVGLSFSVEGWSQVGEEHYIQGVWNRDDDKVRNLYHTEYGVLMITDGHEFPYYRIAPNVYQMKWTETPYGTYRWTMTVINSSTIHNLYESYGSNQSFSRIYTRLVI